MRALRDPAFFDAVLRAKQKAERERDERDRCPVEEGGCGRRGVLCSVTRRGMTLGRFCPVKGCGYNTFGVTTSSGGGRKKRRS